MIEAKTDLPDAGVIFHHLPEHLIGYPAGYGIAVRLPILFVQGEKAQQIDGRFK